MSSIDATKLTRRFKRLPVTRYRDGLSIGYFGSHNGYNQRSVTMVEAKRAKRYVDLTSGGCSVPYQIWTRLGIPVTLNDIGLWSHSCARTALVEGMCPKFDENREALFLSTVTPVVGFAAQFSPMARVYSESVCQFVDGVVTAMLEDPARRWWYSAALGSTLMKNSFRSLHITWTSGGSKRGLPKLLSEWTPEDFCLILLDRLRYFAGKANPGPDNEAFNLDASKFVDAYDGFKDACVYMNPAWPWRPNSGPPDRAHNPYRLSSEFPSRILTGGGWVDDFDWWGRDDYDRIKADVTHWVETPLRKGARVVLVSNQSTNWPSLEESASWFPGARVVTLDERSGDGRPYQEATIVVERRVRARVRARPPRVMVNRVRVRNGVALV